jgi:hypothetical protein
MTISDRYDNSPKLSTEQNAAWRRLLLGQVARLKAQERSILRARAAISRRLKRPDGARLGGDV